MGHGILLGLAIGIYFACRFFVLGQNHEKRNNARRTNTQHEAETHEEDNVVNIRRSEPVRNRA